MNENQVFKTAAFAFLGFLISTICFVVGLSFLMPDLEWLGFTGKIFIAMVGAFGVAVGVAVVVSRRDNPGTPRASKSVRRQTRPDRQSTGIAITFVVVVSAALLVLANKVPSARGTALLAIATLIVVPLVLRVTRGSVSAAEAAAISEMGSPIRVSDRSANKLARSEQVRRETNKHPVVLVLLFPVAVLLGLGVRFLSEKFPDQRIAAAVGVLSGIVLLWKVISWKQDVICITTKRIIEISGILTTKAAAMPVQKMTDTTFSIPWHSHLLAGLRIIKSPYGSFVLESAGQNQALTEVHFVPEAIAVNKLLTEDSLK